MTRTAALTLLLVVLLLGAFGGSAGARDTAQSDPIDAFGTLALLASRPASGSDLYENIHEYMWKQVYVMGAVDYAFPARVVAGQFIFIRTWQGEGHKVLPRGVDFATNDSPAVFFDGEPIVGDAIIHLEPGIELPDSEFELVGTVCGIQKFHVPESSGLSLTPGAGFPVICIPADGRLRIRPLPVVINWLGE